MTIPALSLWQPWASLCVEPRADRVKLTPTGNQHENGLYEYSGSSVAVKSIETRHWPAPQRLIGQRIAIHAAKRAMRVDELRSIGVGERSTIVPGQRTYRTWYTFPGAHKVELPFPFGAVVGTVRLVECLPMLHHDDWGGRRAVVFDVPYQPGVWLLGGEVAVKIDDQVPFGWFEPGRFAWMFEDPQKWPTPVPMVGRQGIFKFDG